MSSFHVVEHFISINGEGRRAGQLALFIRFAGCNLNCAYCDTRWANESDVEFEEYNEEKIIQMIRESGVKNVTLTGGEPLIQKGMKELLQRLRQEDIRVEIETNGSIDIEAYFPKAGETEDNVSFTVDYKLGASGMEASMCAGNFQQIRSCDTVKFVVGSKEDLNRAKAVIEQYQLVKKQCGIYLSPCFGEIDPVYMVDFLIENRLNDVNIQLQLHKIIWDPDKRGV